MNTYTATTAAKATGTPAAVVDTARATIGEHEDPPGSNRQRFAKIAGHPNGQQWCATWVCAILRLAGITLPPSVNTPSSRTMYRSAAARGWAVPISHVRAGDVVHLSRGPLGAWKGHVAIATGAPFHDAAGVLRVPTIEGNTNGKGSATGGAVLAHQRPAREWNLGAWRPPYPTTK